MGKKYQNFWEYEIYSPKKFRVRLVYVIKQMFLVFKQYYAYFHIFFYSHVFSKKLKIII